MKSDLFIRTDGSTEIGLGHLVRCISLGTFLKDLFRITFVCKYIPEQVQSELENLNFQLQKIDKEETFHDLISPKTPVVLDGYSFDTDYQQKIKQTGCPLVCIDDLHEEHFYADLVINHAPGVKRSDYSAEPYTTFALGLDYVLLRKPFLKIAKKLPNQTKYTIDTVLICFGGSDSKNLTLRALNVVIGFKQFKKIIIITGSAYKYSDELMRTVNSSDKTEHHHALNGKKMALAFAGSDVAIVPSSGILFEALATDNISISGMYTDNQKEVYSGFKELGAIIDAGTFSKNEIENAIRQVGEKEKQQNFIDGRSPERIQDLFKSLT